MFLKLHEDGMGNDVWYASTDDGQYDAVAETQTKAVMRVAEHLEAELTKDNDA